jgi:hypothetical protein
VENCRSYDEDEKLCRSYDEEENSVETIMRRKTVKVRMKTKSSVEAMVRMKALLRL